MVTANLMFRNITHVHMRNKNEFNMVKDFQRRGKHEVSFMYMKLYEVNG